MSHASTTGAACRTLAALSTSLVTDVSRTDRTAPRQLRLSRRELLLAAATGCLPHDRSHTDSSKFPEPRRDQYKPWTFTAAGLTRQIWSSTSSGPDVIVLHEITGASTLFFSFCDVLVEKNFRVHAPLLFGSPFRPEGWLSNAFLTLPACLDHTGISCFTQSAHNPLNPWLVELARHISGKDGRPVGAIGMCLTGIQPLAMMRAKAVKAPVLCQPALPFGDAKAKRDLGLPASDVDYAVTRAKAEPMDVLALRFECDTISPQVRLDRLRQLFGDRLIPKTLPGPEPKHSTLVHERNEEAIHAVLDFLRTRLA